MKRLLVAISLISSFTLFGCSQLNDQTKSTKVEETVVGYINSLKVGDVNAYHEYTSFQMANEYKASFIAADPFAPSSFENFVVLQYLIEIYKLASYEYSEQLIDGNDATVEIKLMIPNYTAVIENQLPDIISTFNLKDTSEESKSTKVSLLTKSVAESLKETEKIEMINTFKLQYIDGSWYMVDGGELYDDLLKLVQYANRQFS